MFIKKSNNGANTRFYERPIIGIKMKAQGREMTFFLPSSCVITNERQWNPLMCCKACCGIYLQIDNESLWQNNNRI